MQRLLKKVLLAVGIFLIYFMILRPARGHVVSFIDSHTTYQGIEHSFESATSIKMVSLTNAKQKELYFKAPFGMFFLFAIVGLLFVDFRTKNFLLLVGIHLSIWVIAFISFKIGVAGNSFFLDIMDFFIRYSLPLCTMGLIPMLLLMKQSKRVSTNEG